MDIPYSATDPGRLAKPREILDTSAKADIAVGFMLGRPALTHLHRAGHGRRSCQ